jgi:hypothetical protein
MPTALNHCGQIKPFWRVKLRDSVKWLIENVDINVMNGYIPSKGDILNGQIRNVGLFKLLSVLTREISTWLISLEREMNGGNGFITLMMLLQL